MNGTVIGPDRTPYTLPAEASGWMAFSLHRASPGGVTAPGEAVLQHARDAALLTRGG
ncbi:hypothetical protein SMICM304S_03116 [Streptomyces microflavus]